ncbi:MAG: methionine adenosyltransferase [Ardenticatenales bacterium]
MSSVFSEHPSYLFTSESVTEGHPDKVCDQISDAVLDAYLTLDPRARVACETAASGGIVFVTGEISAHGEVDLVKTTRDVIRDIGYDDESAGLDYRACGILTLIRAQSADIAGGVDHALETRGGVTDDEVSSLGAGDQGMMFGFACTETAELMPLPIALAHGITRKLAEVRKNGRVPYLRPDGKSQVTVEYNRGRPVRVGTVLVSTQHAADASPEQITEDVIEDVIKAVVPADYLDDTRFLVNPSGRFVIGGPVADAGLTGRKIIVDTYGGMASHGGGAFSGKDPTKVDRSGAYAARWVAKNLVAAGIADRVMIQVAYAIGVAEPISLNVDTYGTAHIDPERIDALVAEHFDLRPGAILRDLNLRRPIYRQTAAYGHFGRPDIELPWEATDRADALRRAAGL